MPEHRYPALLQLAADPSLLEAHLANLPVPDRVRGRVDVSLAVARAKLEDLLDLEDTLKFLEKRETFAVLSSSSALKAGLRLKA